MEKYIPYRRISVGGVTVQAAALLGGFMVGWSGFDWQLAGSAFPVLWGQFLMLAGVLMLSGMVPFCILELAVLGGVFAGLRPVLRSLMLSQVPLAELCVFLVVFLLLLTGTLSGNLSRFLTDRLIDRLDVWLDQVFWGEGEEEPRPKKLSAAAILRDVFRIFFLILIPATGVVALLIARLSGG